jgi:hypothetical protein
MVPRWQSVFVGCRVDSGSNPGLTTRRAVRGSVCRVRRFEDSGDPQTGRIRRSDVLLPGLLATVGAAEIVAGGYDPRWLALAMYWLAAGVLCARRIAPLAMPPGVAALYALTPLFGAEVAEPAAWLLLLPFACLSAGLHAERARRLAGLACVLGALAITVAAMAWLTDFDPNLLFGVVFSVGPWALGVVLREALASNRRMAGEAERARLERALAAERAASAERDRIAGELHDALAHALGAMVVQASVASDLLRRDCGAAPAALQDVAQAGRNALAETGRLPGVVRIRESVPRPERLSLTRSPPGRADDRWRKPAAWRWRVGSCAWRMNARRSSSRHVQGGGSATWSFSRCPRTPRVSICRSSRWRRAQGSRGARPRRRGRRLLRLGRRADLRRRPRRDLRARRDVRARSSRRGAHVPQPDVAPGTDPEHPCAGRI